MHRLLVSLTALVALVAVLLAGGVAYIALAFPDVGPAPQITVEGSAEQVERGRYLAQHVSVCTDCHSQREFEFFAGPIVEGTLGQGGERFDRSMGLPGVLHADNITPAALGEWTDGEVLRAFTAGVTRRGRALFPLMPYPAYSTMANDDAHAIVAYLRTLTPIEHEVPETELDFPMSLITKTIPSPARPQARPDPADEVAYGRYMATIAACAACHTPLEGGQPDPTRAYGGGHAYPLPGGVVTAANITPHADTGIGGWTREQFIARFQSMQGRRDRVAEGSFNTVMPWTQYAGMTEQDLGAIYEYLMTVPPVNNAVVRWVPN
jgi:mono/diheme cytochrome c family protein